MVNGKPSNHYLITSNHCQKNRPVEIQRIWWWSVGRSNRDAQPEALKREEVARHLLFI